MFKIMTKVNGVSSYRYHYIETDDVNIIYNFIRKSEEQDRVVFGEYDEGYNVCIHGTIGKVPYLIYGTDVEYNYVIHTIIVEHGMVCGAAALEQ